MILEETLSKYPIFQELEIAKQQAILLLAREFEDNELALYLSPKELTDTLNIGSPDLWTLFLNMEPTKNFIKKEMAERTNIAQRKALMSLTQLAEAGNVQAAKEINELSGIMSKGEDNRVVVLHRVNRPKSASETKAKQKPNNE